MKPILAAKAVKLSNFNVLSLSSQKNTTRVLINPRNIKEVETLNRWSSIDKTPHILLTPLSQRHVKKELKTIREITTECEIFENRSHEGTYSVLGFIGYLKHDDFSSLCYQACSNVKKCKKKVVEVGGFYRCESCRETFPDCTFRYIFTLGFHDSTGYLYATAFDESGISLFGMTGNQLHEFSKDPEHLDEIINRALKKEFIATLRASLNESSQASRVKYLIQKIKAVDVVQTADMLLDEIKSVIQF